MSATRDLIAAALTAAGAVRWQYPELSDELRELCARAMVQPDMAEVERLLLHFEKRASWVRHKQRAALLDYVRGVMVERDSLIHDNERLMQIAAQEVSAAPQTLRAELDGAVKSRNAAMLLYESARQSRDDLVMQQHEWQEALRTLDSERAVNSLLTAQLTASEARAERYRAALAAYKIAARNQRDER